jgi:hypothetical protein
VVVTTPTVVHAGVPYTPVDAGAALVASIIGGAIGGAIEDKYFTSP